MTDITQYWDERTLIIYGLLAGYTKLEPVEISETIKTLVNVQGNVRFCLELLATIEQMQRLNVAGLELNLRKYRGQLEDLSETDENTELIIKVDNKSDTELDDREVYFGNFAELLEQKEIVTEMLYGCITFEVRPVSKKWLHGVVQSYLALYRQNKLFSPTAGAYSTYHQQYVAMTDYLDTPEQPRKVSRFVLPTNVRLLEALYDLVDKDKIEITGFGELGTPDAIEDPTFGISVITDVDIKDLQKTEIKGLKVEAHNYDPANGLLTIAGEHIKIIGQPNKKGKDKESKQAQLMRLLFYSLTFPNQVAFKAIYDDKDTYVDINRTKYKADVVKKAASLAAAINKLVQEKLEVKELVKSDKYKFFINDLYLKN
jgi:hypothetical protein